MELPELVDPCRCPLCGQPNACALAGAQAGQVSEPCWCTLASFPDELLQRVPLQAQRKACICQACVRAAQTSLTAPSSRRGKE